MSRGIYYMILSTLAFAVMTAMAKALSHLHPLQVVFFRALGTFLIIVPYMASRGISILGDHRKLLLIRGFFGTVSIITFFIVLQRIPLGATMSLRYLGPIFGALFAVWLLKESINKWQWLSFAIAFSGVIMMKGFDLRIDLLSFILIMVSAIFLGLAFVMIRYLVSKEHFLTIVNYLMMTSIVTGLLFYNDWSMPTGNDWYSVVGMGIMGMIGQIFLTLAFKYEETNIVAPIKYIELVWAFIIGFMFFGETYTLLPIIGMVLIIIGMIANVRFKSKNVVP